MRTFIFDNLDTIKRACLCGVLFALLGIISQIHIDLDYSDIKKESEFEYLTLDSDIKKESEFEYLTLDYDLYEVRQKGKTKYDGYQDMRLLVINNICYLEVTEYGGRRPICVFPLLQEDGSPMKFTQLSK